MSREIYIGMNALRFSEHKGPGILFQKDEVAEVRGMPGATPDDLNILQAGTEFDAAEEFMPWLRLLIKKDLSISISQYPSIYFVYKETLFKCFHLKHQLLAFEPFLKDIQLLLDLPELYHAFPVGFYHSNAVFITNPEPAAPFSVPLVKDIFYLLFGKLFHPGIPKKQNNRKRILFFTHSPLYNDRLMKAAYDRIGKEPSLDLFVIHCPVDVGGERKDERGLFAKNHIGFYDYTSFKSYPDHDVRPLARALSGGKHPIPYTASLPLIYASAVNQSWTKNIIKAFDPDLVFTTSLGETGRYMADAARSLGIPSAYLEYTLFTDDAYWMEHGVCFDHKLCIGEESINIWKRRKDPSKNHHLLGYLRPISVAPLPTANFLLPTIFFASTWGGTNAGFIIEKQKLVRELIHETKARGYRLILKKHPSETDDTLDKLAAGQEHVTLVGKDEHERLIPLMAASHVICCQNSSIGLEALALEKPFVYLSRGHNRLQKYSVLERIGYAKSFSDVRDFLDSLPEMQEVPVRDIKKKVLFEPEEGVPERFIHFLTRFAK